MCETSSVFWCSVRVNQPDAVYAFCPTSVSVAWLPFMASTPVGAVFTQALMERPRRVEVTEDARTDRSSRQLLRAAEDPLACAARHVTARVKQFRLNPHPK